MNNQHFEKLIASGQPVGEVISVDKFLINVKGLHPVSVHALIMFQEIGRAHV